MFAGSGSGNTDNNQSQVKEQLLETLNELEGILRLALERQDETPNKPDIVGPEESSVLPLKVLEEITKQDRREPEIPNIPPPTSDENFVNEVFSFLDDSARSNVSRTVTKTNILEYFESLHEERFPFNQRIMSPSPRSPSNSRSSSSPSSSSTCSSYTTLTEKEIYEQLYPEYDVTVEILYKTQKDVL